MVLRPLIRSMTKASNLCVNLTAPFIHTEFSFCDGPVEFHGCEGLVGLVVVELEVWVFQGLGCRNSRLGVKHEHFGEEVNGEGIYGGRVESGRKGNSGSCRQRANEPKGLL